MIEPQPIPAPPLPPTPPIIPPKQQKLSELEARERAVAIREKALDEIVATDVSKITHANIDQAVVGEFAMCAFDLFKTQPNIDPAAERALKCTTIAVLVLRNGFVVVGESVVASPDNYDAGAGRKAAIEDAKRQLWALSNYELKSRMAGLLVAPDYEQRRKDYRDAVARAEATSAAPVFAPFRAELAAAESSPTSRLP